MVFKNCKNKMLLVSILFSCVVIGLHGKDEYPCPDRIVKEIHISGGTAGATSFHSHSWLPVNAFLKDPSYGWHNKYRAAFPQTIWYRFRKGFVAEEISFEARSDAGGAGLAQGPTSYQFVGTNDPNCNDLSAWTVLCEDLSGKRFQRYYDTKYCKVDVLAHRNSFSCYGIRILNTADGNGAAALKNIRVWESIEH